MLRLAQVGQILTSDTTIWITSYLLLLALLLTFVSWRSLTGDTFDPYVAFALSAYLFNAGLPLLDVVGLSDRGIRTGRLAAIRVAPTFSDERLADTVLLVLVCLLFMHLGALLTHRPPRPDLRGTIDETAVRRVGLLLMAVSAIPMFLIIRDEVVTRLAGTYATLYQRERLVGIENWWHVLGLFFAPGCLFTLSSSHGKRKLQIATHATTWTLIAIDLTVGVRSSALMMLVAYGWIVHTRYHQLRVWHLFAGILVLFGMVMPTVTVLRDLPNLQHLSFPAIQEAYASLSNPVVITLHEMGTSMYTVAATQEFVPALRPHDHGVGYVHALLNVIPNFLSSLKFDLGYPPPDIWLSDLIDPYYAALGGTSGFSFIAEAYLAFGWWGAPVAIGTVGAMIALMSEWVRRSSDPARIAAVASFLLFVLHFPRGHSEAYTRQLFLYAIVPYCCVLLMRRVRRVQRTNRNTAVHGSLLRPTVPHHG
jgi:hypothetical protein